MDACGDRAVLQALKKETCRYYLRGWTPQSAQKSGSPRRQQQEVKREEPCIHFLRGFCKRGSSCWWPHVNEQQLPIGGSKQQSSRTGT
eukprot:Skav233244  [mRNA]  locus=scaffold2786:74494:77320:- [translate_table: standard]